MNTPESIIGNSIALAEALERLSELAGINRPILVLGERGTGKELAAERLHFLSPRWDAPLVKVNCAAMAESLLDSELFGHESGAFTGATRSHRGRFERADGGTLFLDELGTMSLRLQEKLLRLVEYGEFERLGGQETLRVDVRVVAATHADLPHLARQGTFRQDLLDRLSFDVIHLPPLRYRREDIRELAEHFAIQMSAEMGWEMFPGFTPQALRTLLNETWPGNIRELKSAVERSLFRWGNALAPVDKIIVDPFVSPYLPRSTPTDSGLLDPRESDASAPIDDFTAHMNQLEKDLLIQVLADHAGNQRLTAETVGLTYDQLRGLVRKHDITRRRRRR